MSDTMPANIAAAFAANPWAGLASDMSTWGHAYGKAKRYGSCPLTGANIYIGAAIRHVTVWSRCGRSFTGYCSNEGLGWLQLTGSGEQPLLSHWHRATGAAVADAALAGAKRIKVLKADSRVTEYALEADGRYCRPGRYGGSSPKQLASTLRRSKAIWFAQIGE